MKNKQRYPVIETQLNFKLSNQLKERIEKYAAANEMSVSVAIRKILNEKLAEVEQVERKSIEE